MSTVGDVLKGNSIYENGVFLDNNYYKRHIPPGRFQQAAPSAQEFRTARIQQIALTAFKEFSLMGLVAIPAFYMLGLSVALPTVLAAAVVTISTYDLGRGRDPIDDGWIRGTELRSQLLALLPQKERYHYLFREMFISLAFKVSFVVTAVFGFTSMSVFLAHCGVFTTIAHAVTEVENMALLAVNRQVKQTLQRQQLSAPPSAPLPA